MDTIKDQTTKWITARAAYREPFHGDDDYAAEAAAAAYAAATTALSQAIRESLAQGMTVAQAARITGWTTRDVARTR